MLEVFVAVDAERDVDMEVPGLADHATTLRALVWRRAARPGSLAALRPARRVMPKAANLAFWKSGGSAKKRSSVGLAPGQPPSM